jgi:hypothetical protein
MGSSAKRARSAVVVAAAAALLSVVALPAGAYAHVTTRIVTAKTITVHSETPGTTGWPVTITAKFQKKSGTHYVAAYGTVRFYVWADGHYGYAYQYLGSKKGSSISFSIGERGKYKLVFGGSSTAKPCTAYSFVTESVGLVIGTPVLEVGPRTLIGSGPSAHYVRLVHVRCALNWNTTANPQGFHVLCTTFVYGGIDNQSVLDRYLARPGDVEYWYAVTDDEVGLLANQPYVDLDASVRAEYATTMPANVIASVNILE